MTEPAPRITLRTLPLPAKLVLTCFLIAVGLGYGSAMVQLHMKHSAKNGEALPTVADVVERFSGIKKFDPEDCESVSKVQLLITGSKDATDVSKSNMTPAFFAKSKGYPTECDQRGRQAVDAERETERLAMLDWLKADPQVMKEAYEKDAFPLPRELKGQPIAAAFKAGEAVKIRTLIDQRCQKCHAGESPSLGNWAELAPHALPPSMEKVRGPGGEDYVRSANQIDVEKLTQSTHAHLLSFAVLFTLTGLTFAFTTYWTCLRVVLAPVVLVAQVADVSCWWLARIPDCGPYFAMTIVGTGGVVGTGLFLQIVLGLFNMYGWKGKAVLLLVALLFLGGAGYLGTKVIEPALKQEKSDAEAKKAADANAGPVQKPNDKALRGNPGGNGPEPTKFERLVMGPIQTGEDVKFNGSAKGTMAPAFFHRDGADYKSLTKDATPEEKKKVDDEREGERLAVVAWIKLDDAARRKALAEDKLALPAEHAGKPVTADYLHDDKAVKVQSILKDRCVRCHQPDGDDPAAADYPLVTYEQLLKYLVPEGAAAAEKPIPPAN